MNHPNLDTLVRRLDRLERENRRWKRVSAATFAAIAALVLMGQATPRRVVEAEKFVLRDLNGKDRGRQ